MKIVLVAGGSIDREFCLDFLKQQNYDKIIAIDKGLEFLYREDIKPDLIVGDFDSLSDGILDFYEEKVPIRQFVPEKDATDMEIGIRSALEMGAKHIAILGGTGTRIDHMLGNIQTLMIPLKQGVEAFIQDKYNRITLLNNKKTLRREHMFGNFVSFLPLTTIVEGLDLKGFKYPLEHYTMTSDNSLGVSNEVTEEEAVVQFQSGVLIMIESRDK